MHPHVRTHWRRFLFQIQCSRFRYSSSYIGIDSSMTARISTGTSASFFSDSWSFTLFFTPPLQNPEVEATYCPIQRGEKGNEYCVLQSILPWRSDSFPTRVSSNCDAHRLRCHLLEAYLLLPLCPFCVFPLLYVSFRFETKGAESMLWYLSVCSKQMSSNRVAVFTTAIAYFDAG